jgi:tRNA threonylcarbamoyladenosine biosynthesis protein TsaB
MPLLAIDTTGELCSCALLVTERPAVRAAQAPRAHTRHLLPMVQRLLAEHELRIGDLTAVAFAAGPGSFTGVRIAASMAQGLGMAAGATCVAVSSLAALAQRAHVELGAERVLVCTDARMQEVYHGLFRLDGADGVMRADGEEAVSDPTGLLRPGGAGWIGVGSGFRSYTQALDGAVGAALEGVHPQLEADAGEIAVLGTVALAHGEGTDAAQAVPRYVRDKVALTRAERAALPT